MSPVALPLYTHTYMYTIYSIIMVAVIICRGLEVAHDPTCSKFDPDKQSWSALLSIAIKPNKSKQTQTGENKNTETQNTAL